MASGPARARSRRSLHRRHLHRLVDRRCTHVERAAEDEREAEHVVHLVGVIGATGRDDHVRAHLLGELGTNLWVRIREREDHGLSAMLRTDRGTGDPRRTRRGRRPHRRRVLERALLGVDRERLVVGQPSRPLWITPWRSSTRRFSGRKPISSTSFRHAVPAAPPPRHTIFTSSMRLPCSSSALRRPRRRRSPCRADRHGTPVRGIAPWRFLDLEAVQGTHVLDVDAAEGVGDACHRRDEGLGVFGIDLDVEAVDPGEALEQQSLAFHHRLARQVAKIAEAENGGAVGDDADEIALARVVVGRERFLGDAADRLGDPGCRRARDRARSPKAW